MWRALRDWLDERVMRWLIRQFEDEWERRYGGDE